jgi:sigma-54 dependent transcriptional regulator, acetoin dehydrogenase operon transcriptional activator AcoR
VPIAALPATSMKTGRLLFLSTDNAVRSQMAEALARQVSGDRAVVFSAGCRQAVPIHPLTLKTLADLDIDIDGLRSKSLEELKDIQFDLAVRISSRPQNETPLLAGVPAVLEWVVADPSVDDDRSSTLEARFHQCAEQIRTRVADLFELGYFSAFLTQQRNLNSVLNSISDAVIVHDLQRRLFFISQGATQLTGLSASQVLGRDCNEVFSPRLCGENCSFCFGPVDPDFEEKRYNSVYYDPEGNRRDLDVCVIPLRDIQGRLTGIIASLSDVSHLKALERRVGNQKQFRGIIGSDPAMLQLFQQIRDLSAYDYPVHIQGETGAGKELVALAIHEESDRAGRPFVPINCGALPEGLVESELFGHTKGAFSGAIRHKKGRFELAQGGTIFLDEVADLPKTVQVKLLRFLQEGVLEKIGSETTVTVDVRVISATNKDLKQETRKGNFREDLFYRLNVIPLHLPPLRERKGDLLPLIDHFLRRPSPAGLATKTISNEALALMMDYDWPGNIRELENVIRFAQVKSRGEVILPEDLPAEIRQEPDSQHHSRSFSVTAVKASRKLDVQSVRDALIKTGGNKAKAARRLGVGRATLYRFLDSRPDLTLQDI